MPQGAFVVIPEFESSNVEQRDDEGSTFAEVVLPPMDPDLSTPYPSVGVAENQQEHTLNERLSEVANGAAPPKRPFLEVPAAPKEEPRFATLQYYEGTVTEVGKSDFVARLRDLRDPEADLQQATIDGENVSDVDRNLVKPGAVFYWAIGYDIGIRGRRQLVSTIRFRRLPAWRKTDIDRLRTVGASWDSFFEQND
jgi:hypothetical protein